MPTLDVCTTALAAQNPVHRNVRGIADADRSARARECRIAAASEVLDAPRKARATLRVLGAPTSLDQPHVHQWVGNGGAK